MADEDTDNEKQAEDSSQQRDDKIRAAGKTLAAQGFSKEQIAAQLSSKYQITVDEATAVLGDDEPAKDDA